MHPRYASLVLAAFVATLTACGTDNATNVLPGAEPVVSAPDYAVTLADGTIQMTVGEVKAFTVSARVKKSRTVRWSSSNTTVATVSSTGTVTAKVVGTAQITASGSNGSVDRFSTAVVSGTTTVATVAKVASVLVSVPATTMTLGASQTATATARDSAGAVITGRTVTWSVSSGTSLMVNASGVVTALAGGTESVVATVDGVKGAQALTVATVTSVAVSPKTGTALAPAQTRQFTTVATWSDQVTRPVSITYTATGGTISTSGLYTAGQLAGTFMVIANCACGRADTAAVSIVLPAQLTSLSISPKIATVNAGATQQFSAVANWSTGATTLPPTTYSATGGVVSTTGLWTAPSTAGTYKVIVAHTGGTLKDTASVTVQAATTGTATTTGASVLFSDDFESGGFATAQNGVRWTSLPWVEMSTGFARRGTKSMAFRQGDSKEWAEARFGGLPKLPEVFMQFWLYQPTGTEAVNVGPSVQIPGARNDKFFRLWGGEYTGINDIKFGASTWQGKLGVEYKRNLLDGTVWPMGEGGEPTAPDVINYHPLIGNTAYKGRWVRVRIQCRVATPDQDNGVIRIWLDDLLVLDRQKLRAYAGTGGINAFESGYLLGWANNGFPTGQRMYIDDFSISTGAFAP